MILYKNQWRIEDRGIKKNLNLSLFEIHVCICNDISLPCVLNEIKRHSLGIYLHLPYVKYTSLKLRILFLYLIIHSRSNIEHGIDAVAYVIRFKARLRNNPLNNALCKANNYLYYRIKIHIFY